MRSFGIIRISDPRDHSDHGRSNEPMNPRPGWIHRFIWSTKIRVISDHWFWSGSSQRNARFHWQSDEFIRSWKIGKLQKNCQRAFPLVLGGLWWPVQKKKKKWRTTWETILLRFGQCQSNFRYIVDLSSTRTLIMATEHEDPAAWVIFLGIFLGTGRVFRWVLQRTTRLNTQTVELPRVRCCRGKMLDFQAWKVTRSKNFTKKYMEIAPFYIDRSKVLAILS